METYNIFKGNFINRGHLEDQGVDEIIKTPVGDFVSVVMHL
jgi:hypothetical protein